MRHPARDVTMYSSRSLLSGLTLVVNYVISSTGALKKWQMQDISNPNVATHYVD
jgi:hypothetical protein